MKGMGGSRGGGWKGRKWKGGRAGWVSSTVSNPGLWARLRWGDADLEHLAHDWGARRAQPWGH